MTYNHKEDPDARAHWIVVKWLVSRVTLKKEHEECITRIARALIDRGDHTKSIEMVPKDKLMLEKINYASAVGYDRPPYMVENGHLWG